MPQGACVWDRGGVGCGDLAGDSGGSGPDLDCCFLAVLITFPQKILIGVK